MMYSTVLIKLEVLFTSLNEWLPMATFESFLLKILL